MIWDNRPRTVFVGSDTLHLGIYNAVATFNIGCQASLNILKEAGIEPGKFCTKEMSCTDLVRVHGELQSEGGDKSTQENH
jgi:hypothetical protein